MYGILNAMQIAAMRLGREEDAILFCLGARHTRT